MRWGGLRLAPLFFAFTASKHSLNAAFTCLLLNCQIRLEFAFGLFAVFSMLRNRTANMSMRNMTYLFAAGCIGLINAIAIGLQALWADGALNSCSFGIFRPTANCQLPN